MNKKLTATILTAVMATNLAITPVFAESYSVSVSNNSGVTETKKIDIRFSDVKEGDWFYQPVMELAGKGLVGGTTKPVNGVGTYEPNKAMTRAEFATILVGYLYPEELKAYDGPYNSYWYSGIYGVAIDTGLIKTSEFSEAAMNEGTSRQEMALLLVRAMDAMGIDTTEMVDTAVIPDFNQIDSYYKDYVRVVYAKQLVGGMDKAGTFAPKYTMNRAQAATVLNKLTDPSTRTPASDVVDTGDIDTGSVNIGQVTGKSWYEGGKHEGFPKVGDTVIKSDGTKVVLTSTNISGYEILGYGQGVDFITGLTVNGVTIKRDNLCRAWSGYGAGNDRSQFIYDPVSNETHTVMEWTAIMTSTYPEKSGSYDGEMKNTYFKWHAGGERWIWTGPQV